MPTPEKKTIPRYVRTGANTFRDRYTGDIHITVGGNPPGEWIQESEYLKLIKPTLQKEKN